MTEESEKNSREKEKIDERTEENNEKVLKPSSDSGKNRDTNEIKTENKEKQTENNDNIYFPYEKVRNEQNKLIKDIQDAVINKKNIIAHAPTGLGKTAAALSPIIKHAIDNNLKVFFLTSRHTQHKIAVETLKEIRTKYNLKFNAADIIGKKWMCCIEGADSLFSTELIEYCRSMKEKDTCAFYSKTREKGKNQISVEAKKILGDLCEDIRSSEEITEHSSKFELCPYEISIELAKKSTFIIADYYYIFNSHIREQFLKKIGGELENTIVIIDEAHNLPERIRELATVILTNLMIKRGIKEAKRYNYMETVSNLAYLQDVLNRLVRDMKEKKERKITKEYFMGLVNEERDYHELITDLEMIAESVREKQRRSNIGAIVNFLQKWEGQEEGFTRILSVNAAKEGDIVSLSYRCLDPSIFSGEIFREAHSTIMMSGTLTPTEMYRDILGLDESNTIEREYKSPFPDNNRINLVIPKTTTKFSQRSTKQYENIADITAELVNKIKGNVFIFFPSYHIRDSVYLFFMNKCKKTIFLEDPRMNKQQRIELLEKFKRYNKVGAVLLGIASGSFGEGIDMPGDLLNGVIIVGLPLRSPDLETKELIDYFDKKYGKGWDYGYLYPAFQKSLQNAGRCIRSETDKGIIIFLDERYLWPNYRRLFPKDWEMEVSKDPLELIEDFFS